MGLDCWPKTHSGTHSQATTVVILSRFNLQALPIYKLHPSMVSSLQEHHPPMTAVLKQTKNPALLARSQEALPGKSCDLRKKTTKTNPKATSDVAGPTSSPWCSSSGLEVEIHAGFGVNLVIWLLLKSQKAKSCSWATGKGSSSPGLIQPISHKSMGSINGNPQRPENFCTTFSNTFREAVINPKLKAKQLGQKIWSLTTANSYSAGKKITLF